jgi:hypothetical protein
MTRHLIEEASAPYGEDEILVLICTPCDAAIQQTPGEPRAHWWERCDTFRAAASAAAHPGVNT